MTTTRDGIPRTRADLFGVVLTLVALVLSAFSTGDWLLVPALYWTVLLGMRLIREMRRTRLSKRDPGAL